MPVPPVILASVVDARADGGNAKDCLLVDTNVWYWQTYVRASISDLGRARHYSAFLKRVLHRGGKLCRCGLSLTELAHLVEQTEFDLASHAGFGGALKDFRYDPARRTKVVEAIKECWHQVEQLSSMLEFPLSAKVASATLQLIESAALDVNDAILVLGVKSKGLTGIVTDDADFCCVPGLTVFTANRAVVEAAASAGRLTVREPKAT